MIKLQKISQNYLEENKHLKELLTLSRPGGGIYAPLFKNDRISLIWVGRVRMLISLNLSMSMTVILTPFRGPSDAWVNSDPPGKSMDFGLG